MRPPRFRLLTLIVVILGLGLILGGLARRYEQGRRHAAVWARLDLQEQVTAAALAEVVVELRQDGRRPFTASGSEGRSGPDERHWAKRTKVQSGDSAPPQPLIRLDVEGGTAGRGVGPILVKDFGWPGNGRAIERLAAAYRERKWPYRVVTASESEALPGR
jgi:hypothetical protein